MADRCRGVLVEHGMDGHGQPQIVAIARRAAGQVVRDELDAGSGLGRHEVLDAWCRADGKAGCRQPVAQEVGDRPEARVAVLRTDRAGVDQHEVGGSQRDGLVEPRGVVVEERQRAGQPVLERRGQLMVARQAVHDRLGSHPHRRVAATADGTMIGR